MYRFLLPGLLILSISIEAPASPDAFYSRVVPVERFLIKVKGPAVKPSFNRAARASKPRVSQPKPRLRPPQVRKPIAALQPGARTSMQVGPAKQTIKTQVQRRARPAATRAAFNQTARKGRLRESFRSAARVARSSRLTTRTSAGVRKATSAFNTRAKAPRRLSPTFKQAQRFGKAKAAFSRAVGYPPAVAPIRQRIARPGQVFYQAYHGKAGRGAWATQVRPKNSHQARHSLALPPQNRATRLRRIVTRGGERYTSSRAAPVKQWGRQGRGRQVRFHDRLPKSAFTELGWLKGGLKTVFTDNARKSPMPFLGK